MALTSCAECGGKVSTEAAACPHCGAPVKRAAATPPAFDPERDDGSTPPRGLSGRLFEDAEGLTDVAKIFFLVVAALLAVPLVIALVEGKLGGEVLTVVATVVVAGMAYFAPALIASHRKHRQATAIFVLNFFLGWTGLGWIAALVWAATNTGRS